MNRFEAAPRFIVHTLNDVCAVLEAGRVCGEPIVFQNSPETFRALGPAWFAALAQDASDRFPDVEHKAMLACDDAPAFVLAALRLGVNAFQEPPEGPSASRVLAALKAADALIMKPAKTFDLLDCDRPLSACIEWIREHNAQKERT